MSNYYTSAEARYEQNKWRSNRYGASTKEKDDIVARKNAEKEEERRRREAEREAERRRKEAEREAERRRKEAERQAQREAERIRREEEREAERRRKEAEKAQTEANARQEKYEREKLIAQKRQAQKDAQWRDTGTPSADKSKTPTFTAEKTKRNTTGPVAPSPVYEKGLWEKDVKYATPKLNYTPGKIEVRSTIMQSQWKKDVSGQNNTANSNVVKNNVPKATKAEQDAFINKYLPKLMGAESTQKAGYGPNREMASIVKLASPKTTVPKTVAVPKQTANAAGPNAEMVNSVVLENQKWKPEIGTGPNVEIGQKNFLDHRENNVFKSYFDEYRYDKIIENAYKPQEEYFVGKDSIYKKDAKEISKDYKNVYNTVQTEYLKRKEDLADLEFDKKYARLDNAGLQRLEKTRSEVEKLDFIRKKAALGAKMNFAFLGNDMDKLSKMSIDDILNSEETDYNLPYLSPVAQFARSTNQSIGQIKNAVDVVEGVKIEYRSDKKDFLVFNSKEPRNRFSFKIKNVRSNRGYTEPKIIVDRTPTDYQELIVKDLRDVMDNLTVPDNTEKMLKNLADGKALSVVSGGLDVTSAVFDLTDLAVVLSSDLSDDGKAGDDFSRELFGTAASWAGDYVGGVAGAKAGAALGMIFGPVGAVIGGTLGAVAGAYIMSKVMEDVGRYVGESLDDSEYTIDRYHQRAK